MNEQVLSPADRAAAEERLRRAMMADADRTNDRRQREGLDRDRRGVLDRVTGGQPVSASGDGPKSP